MMCKYILKIASLFIISVILLSCSDDNTSNYIANTAIDLNTPNTIAGSYSISTINIEINNKILSNACVLLSGVNNCEDIYLVSAVANIVKDLTVLDLTQTTYKLTTKLQFFNTNIINNFHSEAYQYLEFPPIPMANINADGINIENGVKGFTGRNMAFNMQYPDASYSFTYNDITKILTQTIIIPNVQLNGGCSEFENVKITINMAKIADATATLDGNYLDNPTVSLYENGTIYTPYDIFQTTTQALECN